MIIVVIGRGGLSSRLIRLAASFIPHVDRVRFDRVREAARHTYLRRAQSGRK